MPNIDINTMVSLAIQTHTTNNQNYLNAAVDHLENYDLSIEQKKAIIKILRESTPRNAVMGREISQILCPKILERMPQDLLHFIFSYLSVKDIFMCFLICKSMHQKTQNAKQNEILWEHIYHRDFDRSDFAARPPGFFQAIRNIYRFGQNLQTGVYCTKKSLEGNKKIASFAVGDHMLYASFWDKTLGAWDLATGKYTEIPNEGEGEKIDSIAFFGKRLYLANLETSKPIRVFDLVTKKYLPPLKENTVIEAPLVISGDKLCLSVQHDNIEVWNLSAGTLSVFQKYDECVASLAICGEKLCLCYSAGDIDIYDLNTGKRLRTLPEKIAASFLSTFNQKLVLGSWDQTIKVWDLDTGECLKEFYASHTSNTAICGRMLCLNPQAGAIEIWDLETDKRLHFFEELQGVYSSIFVSDGNLYAIRSDDNRIQVLDFKAEHLSVFKELAHLFRGDEMAVQQAMVRFSRMPEEAKNKIYGELQSILAPSSDEYSERTKDAFHGQKGQSSTSMQKALAIESYIDSQISNYT